MLTLTNAQFLELCFFRAAQNLVHLEACNFWRFKEFGDTTFLKILQNLESCAISRAVQKLELSHFQSRTKFGDTNNFRRLANFGGMSRIWSQAKCEMFFETLSLLKTKFNLKENFKKTLIPSWALQVDNFQKVFTTQVI